MFICTRRIPSSPTASSRENPPSVGEAWARMLEYTSASSETISSATAIGSTASGSMVTLAEPSKPCLRSSACLASTKPRIVCPHPPGLVREAGSGPVCPRSISMTSCAQETDSRVLSRMDVSSRRSSGSLFARGIVKPVPSERVSRDRGRDLHDEHRDDRTWLACIPQDRQG